MKFNGSIEFIEFELLIRIINEAFPIENIIEKIRVFGEEVNIDSENIELYVHNQSHNSVNFIGNKGSFVIQGNIKLELKNALKELNKLMAGTTKNGHHYNFDIYPDEKDESFELNLRSPDYDKYMDQINKKHRS